MINTLRTIAIIAANERRMLYRQARFWVLTLIGLGGILFFMVVMTLVSIMEDNIPGEFLLEGTDAYLALYFFSYLQAILIIFIAGDFRKAEEKAQLDQVMLSRPMIPTILPSIPTNTGVFLSRERPATSDSSSRIAATSKPVKSWPRW